jgi:hypothetical protein
MFVSEKAMAEFSIGRWPVGIGRSAIRPAFLCKYIAFSSLAFSFSLRK